MLTISVFGANKAVHNFRYYLHKSHLIMNNGATVGFGRHRLCLGVAFMSQKLISWYDEGIAFA
jgi:hypothetical protein